MGTQMVRLSARSHGALARLAQESGLSRQAILDRAIEQYRRERFFDALDDAYRRLRADPAAEAEYRQEMQEWDGVIADGLEGVRSDA